MFQGSDSEESVQKIYDCNTNGEINRDNIQLEAPIIIKAEESDKFRLKSLNSQSLSEIGVYDNSPGYIENYVSVSLQELEEKLELALENISDDLASEVTRERQHLILMQEQVNSQGKSLQKQFSEIKKKIDQESTLRTMIQQKNRESNEKVTNTLNSISKELNDLKELLNKSNQPWLLSFIGNLCNAFNQCSGTSIYPSTSNSSSSNSTSNFGYSKVTDEQ